MRILGLDLGEKRIGAAVSDPLGITAQGIDTISYSRPEEALQKIKDICLEYEIEKVVVGNPIQMSGLEGPASVAAANFADRLREELVLPVELIDERLTTRIAEKILINGGVRRKKRRKVRDKLAAVLILETYLSTVQNDCD